MTQYNMRQEVDELAQKVRDNPVNQALEPLRVEQRRVAIELMQKTDVIQQYIFQNDPLDCNILKWIVSRLGGEGRSCRHCHARHQCNGHAFRQAPIMLHIAHISEIGRKAKRDIVGGKIQLGVDAAPFH
jgi:hypothetical protein